MEQDIKELKASMASLEKQNTELRRALLAMEQIVKRADAKAGRAVEEARRATAQYQQLQRQLNRVK